MALAIESGDAKVYRYLVAYSLDGSSWVAGWDAKFEPVESRRPVAYLPYSRIVYKNQ